MEKDYVLGDVLSRLVSYLIDALVLAIIDIILFFILAGDFNASYMVGVLVQVLYFTYFFGNGSTPGMNVLDLKLIKKNNTRPTYVTGLIRYVGMVISATIFLLGFIWIIFDNENQGWHDKLANTLVVKEINGVEAKLSKK